MEAWLEFGRGPLFRISFVIMILGLARLVALQIIGMIETFKHNEDHIVAWRDITKTTLSWLVPIFSIWKKLPLYSLISFGFHIGLILVPLFLAAHVMLWKSSVGFGWFKIPQELANWLTILTIVTGLLLFILRIANRNARFISRRQDFIWPILLIIPFLTGFLCSNVNISAGFYQAMMLIHLLSANLIMILIPFTKVAHCVLMPLSHYISGTAWKFPVGGGDRVIETIGYAGKPTWMEKPRIGVHTSEITVKEEQAS